jgi:LmbE family N-acetylglucosaminyl deacetylase
LGVVGHRIVGVPDKAVETLPRPDGVREVARELDRVRPQVVLTFHHGGVSGHPDHIAVASFLDGAVDAAGPLKYYQWGIPRELEGLYDRPNLVPMEESEVAAVITVPAEAMDRKIAAIESHETQIEFFQSLKAHFDYRAVASREFFSLRRPRVSPSRAQPGGVETDLFNGVPGWTPLRA